MLPPRVDNDEGKVYGTRAVPAYIREEIHIRGKGGEGMVVKKRPKSTSFVFFFFGRRFYFLPHSGWLAGFFVRIRYTEK